LQERSVKAKGQQAPSIYSKGGFAARGTKQYDTAVWPAVFFYEFAYTRSMSSARKAAYLAGICLAGLLVLLLTTQPAQAPAPVLIMPFLLLFLFLASGFYGVARWRGVSGGRSMGLALLLAGVPTILLALQSLGQLSWRDTVTIVVLFAVAYIYMSRISRTRQG
jgi:hypothetical protein